MRGMVEGYLRGLVSYPSTTLRVAPLPMRRMGRHFTNRHPARQKLKERESRGEPEGGEAGFGDHRRLRLLCSPFFASSTGGR